MSDQNNKTTPASATKKAAEPHSDLSETPAEVAAILKAAQDEAALDDFHDDIDLELKAQEDQSTRHHSQPRSEPSPTMTSFASAHESIPSAKRSKLSWLALGLSLVALIGLILILLFGYGQLLPQWQRHYTEQQQQLSQQRELTHQLSLQLTQQTQQTTGSLNQWQRTANEQQEQLEFLQSQIQELRLSQRQLQALSQKAPDHWVLAEADYLIRMAGQKLWIEADPISATALLQSADERIASLHDASLVTLRRALHQDIQTLRGLTPIDVDGISLQLDGMIAQIDTLPVKTTVIPDSIQSQPVQEISDDPSEWQQNLLHAWDDLVDSFIRVEHRTGDISPLLSPNQQWYLTANIRLLFQQAQMAALRGHSQHYKNSLQQASDWLKDYFKTDQTSVQQMRQSIAELIIKPVQLKLPSELLSRQLIQDTLDTQPASTPLLPPESTEAVEAVQ